MKHLLSILFLTSLTSIAQIRTASTTVGSSNDVDIEVTINDFTGVTSFEVSGPSSLWFATAYNTTNMNGYAIVHNNSGGNPVEYTMNGNGAPTLQTNQNLQNITSSTSGAVKTFNYTRLNNTGNTNDYTFSTTTTSLNIAYAIGSGASLAYHGPNRGSATLTFTNPCASSVYDTLTEISVCESELIDVFGDMVGAGTYNDTIWSSIGCDSIIQVQVVNQDLLTITNEIDTLICNTDPYSVGSIHEEFLFPGSYLFHDTIGCAIDKHNVQVVNYETNVFLHPDGSTLEAYLNSILGADAYWYMCDQDSIIPNSGVVTTLTVTMPGEYAFINSGVGCSDTSGCVTVTAEDLGIISIDQSYEFYVKDKMVTIINPMNLEYSGAVYNSLGQVIVTLKNQHIIDLRTLPDGVYVMRLNNKEGIVEQKVLIH